MDANLCLEIGEKSLECIIRVWKPCFRMIAEDPWGYNI